MTTAFLAIHVLLALALIGIVLLQRSEGGGLGIGGGGSSGGGMGGFMTGRSAANVLTRATAILAAIFVVSSLGLTILATGGGNRSIMDAPQSAPTSAPAQAPAAPAVPSAPVK
jgi:preprotein translocase subunit SecG